MTRKSSATIAENDPVTTEAASLEQLQKEIEELKKKVLTQEQQLDDFKKKEEGWLVWTANPMYNGMTMSVLFTDGMAFIPVDRLFPEGNAKKVVGFLTSDFGYVAEYFTKEQTEELQKRIKDRANQRRELQQQIGSREDLIEKMMQSHRF